MEKIKTLLERARPELLEALKEQKEKYPTTNERLMSFLTQNYFCNEITWGLWIDLRSAAFDKTKQLAQDPWELFEDF